MTADLQGEKNKRVAVVSSVLASKSSVRPQPPPSRRLTRSPTYMPPNTSRMPQCLWVLQAKYL